MKIQFTDGHETITVDTDILWFVELDTPKSFDEILIGVIKNYKARGYEVVMKLTNWDALEYIYANLENGKALLTK